MEDLKGISNFNQFCPISGHRLNKLNNNNKRDKNSESCVLSNVQIDEKFADSHSREIVNGPNYSNYDLNLSDAYQKRKMSEIESNSIDNRFEESIINTHKDKSIYY
jgi:hypothetical protein